MLADNQGAGEAALLLRQLDGQHALRAAALRRVLGDLRALAIAVLGDDQQLGLVAGDVHREDAVLLPADLALDVHSLDAGGVAAHRAHLGLREAGGVAGLRHQQDVLVPLGEADPDELVAVADLDGDDAVGLDLRVVGDELRLLDHALRGGEDQVLALREVARGLHGHHALALAEGQHVHQGAPLRGPRPLRKLIDLEAVDLPAVREEEQEVVGRADVEMLDVVVLLEVHPHDAAAATVLLAVGRERQPLHVAGVGDRDHHLLLGDHVLDVDVALEVGDLGAALVAVALLELAQLLDDQGVDPRRVAEDRPELADELRELGVLLADLVGLHGGEAGETHVEDRLRLFLGELELVYQAGAGGVRVGRGADQLDHRVEVVQRDEKALEDVGAGLGAAQLVLGAPRYDLALMDHVVVDQLLQRERPWHAVDEGDHVHAEAGLQLGALVEVVGDDVGVRAALQLDHDAHARAVGLVAKVGDPVQLLLANQVGDLLDQPAVAALLDHERKLGDDQRLLATLER